ncbi:Spore coat protein SA [Planctomycetes bacterium Pla163]|uniref:Spore coat protein SA n=1 Tax=Rohdeia mirabilis TaxID=2528008 RepID=A0A518D071_9BACT|nr:Spore coat protein SA [Planctomycetes bacterium Pla163]
MKILHLCTTLDVGGAEMHLLSQVRGQAARGHEPSVAYLKGAGTLADDFRAAGAREVVAVGGALGVARSLMPMMRRADVVHTHLLKADVLGAVAATLAGRRRRLISSKHNDEQVLRRPLVSRVHGLVGRLPQRTIVLSDHVGRFIERYGRVPARRLTRIYYGLDPVPFEEAAALDPARRESLRRELGVQPTTTVFLCVARFAAQKAHDVLLTGFARARERTQAPLALWLVGDDPFGDGRERAEATAARLELGESVRFLGIRRDVPHLMAAADVFTMTSLWEGLGLVFLEAMATGRPVLASGVSAVPEVVVDGETGLLVPPSDPDAWAAAAVRLAADPELRSRLGARGAQVRRERFGIDRMIDETIAVYEAVLERASA